MPALLRFAAAVAVLAAALGGRMRAAGAADLDGAALQAYVAQQAPLLGKRLGRPLPQLSASEWAQVAAGKPVKKRTKLSGDSLQVASITQVVRQPPIHLLLSFADVDHDEQFMPDVAEAVVLEQKGDGSCLQYGYLDIPGFLVSDRHWVVNFRTNPDLYAASGGKVWEWSFHLVPDAAARIGAARAAGRLGGRLTPKQLDSAVLVASTEGGWTLMALPDGRTLATYQVKSDIGGSVPDSIVATFATATLDDLVRVVTKRASTIYSHYNASHPAIAGPDGVPLPKR